MHKCKLKVCCISSLEEAKLAIKYGAESVSDYVDAILLDSGNPNALKKELGGTGKTHNWTISAKIVDAIDIPVYLAGGLNYSNVSDAISRAKPHGVDLCSGIRSNDELDEDKLASFRKKLNSSLT